MSSVKTFYGKGKGKGKGPSETQTYQTFTFMTFPYKKNNTEFKIETNENVCTSEDTGSFDVSDWTTAEKCYCDLRSKYNPRLCSYHLQLCVLSIEYVLSEMIRLKKQKCQGCQYPDCNKLHHNCIDDLEKMARVFGFMELKRTGFQSQIAFHLNIPSDQYNTSLFVNEIAHRIKLQKFMQKIVIPLASIWETTDLTEYISRFKRFSSTFMIPFSKKCSSIRLEICEKFLTKHITRKTKECQLNDIMLLMVEEWNEHVEYQLKKKAEKELESMCHTQEQEQHEQQGQEIESNISEQDKNNVNGDLEKFMTSELLKIPMEQPKQLSIDMLFHSQTKKECEKKELYELKEMIDDKNATIRSHENSIKHFQQQVQNATLKSNNTRSFIQQLEMNGRLTNDEITYCQRLI
jgi:hypothetical protein